MQKQSANPVSQAMSDSETDKYQKFFQAIKAVLDGRVENLNSINAIVQQSVDDLGSYTERTPNPGDLDIKDTWRTVYRVARRFRIMRKSRAAFYAGLEENMEAMDAVMPEFPLELDTFTADEFEAGQFFFGPKEDPRSTIVEKDIQLKTTFCKLLCKGILNALFQKLEDEVGIPLEFDGSEH